MGNALTIKKFTAIVLAGGFGSRLNGFKNPYHSKPFILANDGNFLLHHTINQLVLSNCIRDFHVTARQETRYLVEDELKKYHIPYSIHLVSGNERVREVLVSLMQYIDDNPFFIVCGHAPPTYSHISQMGKFISENGGQAVSCFSESKKHMSVSICDQTNLILDCFLNSDTDNNSPTSYFRVDSPLLINKNTVLRVRDEGYKYWYDKYLFEDIKNGKKVGGFIANFPAEADTVDEVMKTLDFLNNYTNAN